MLHTALWNFCETRQTFSRGFVPEHKSGQQSPRFIWHQLLICSIMKFVNQCAPRSLDFHGLKISLSTQTHLSNSKNCRCMTKLQIPASLKIYPKQHTKWFECTNTEADFRSYPLSHYFEDQFVKKHSCDIFMTAVSSSAPRRHNAQSTTLDNYKLGMRGGMDNCVCGIHGLPHARGFQQCKVR